MKKILILAIVIASWSTFSLYEHNKTTTPEQFMKARGGEYIPYDLKLEMLLEERDKNTEQTEFYEEHLRYNYQHSPEYVRQNINKFLIP